MEERGSSSWSLAERKVSLNVKNGSSSAVLVAALCALLLRTRNMIVKKYSKERARTNSMIATAKSWI